MSMGCILRMCYRVEPRLITKQSKLSDGLTVDNVDDFKMIRLGLHDN